MSYHPSDYFMHGFLSGFFTDKQLIKMYRNSVKTVLRQNRAVITGAGMGGRGLKPSTIKFYRSRTSFDISRRDELKETLYLLALVGKIGPRKQIEVKGPVALFRKLIDRHQENLLQIKASFTLPRTGNKESADSKRHYSPGPTVSTRPCKLRVIRGGLS
jgi:hypothetical protein